MLLYTPAEINGAKFSRCLIDTGSEVNLIPSRDVTKHGFQYDPAGVKKIAGFNGSTGRVLGSLEGSTKYGPCQEERMLSFLVTPEISVPILGLPALATFELLVDPMDRTLISREDGQVVHCSAVTHTPKN